MQHGKERKVASFGQEDRTACSQAHYAAFYADVNHCLDPVTSGHRLSLTYSLCWKSPGLAVPDITPSEPLEHISSILTPWSTIPGRYNRPIGILLEHEYTDQYFSDGMNHLKGQDAEVIKALLSYNMHALPDAKLRIVLATFSRNVSEHPIGGRYRCDDDNEDWEMFEDDKEVECAVDVTGQSLECTFDIDKLVVIDMASDTIFGSGDDNEWWGDAVDTDIEGYTGNAGPTRNTVYEKHIIVLYPIKFEFDQMLSSNGLEGGAEALLESTSRCSHVDDNLDLTLELSQWETIVARYIIESKPTNQASFFILKLTVQWKRLDLACRFLESLEEKKRAWDKAQEGRAFRFEQFDPLLDVVGLLQCFGWPSLRDRLQCLLPLLSDCYTIAATLLGAELLPIADPLITTLCNYGSDSNAVKQSAQDMWLLYTALLNLGVQWKRDDLVSQFLESLEAMKRTYDKAQEERAPRNKQLNPPLDVLGLLQCFGWLSLSDRLRSLLPLLSDHYAIAATLLDAKLLPKEDPLIVTLCDNWSHSILTEKTLQDMWMFYTALDDPRHSREMAMQLHGSKASHRVLFTFLKTKMTNDVKSPPKSSLTSSPTARSRRMAKRSLTPKPSIRFGSALAPPSFAHNQKGFNFAPKTDDKSKKMTGNPLMSTSAPKPTDDLGTTGAASASDSVLPSQTAVDVGPKTDGNSKTGYNMFAKKDESKSADKALALSPSTAGEYPSTLKVAHKTSSSSSSSSSSMKKEESEAKPACSDYPLLSSSAPKETVLVQIVLDAFLNDATSLLYSDNLPEMRSHNFSSSTSTVNPMWALTWNFFTHTDDVARQRMLAQTVSQTFSLERLQLFITSCIDTTLSPFASDSNMGIVLTHWLNIVAQRTAPVFSWTLPYNMHGHPQVEAFFRDPHQLHFMYQNFGGIQEARRWAASLKEKSCTAQASGTGKRAHVIIEKTKDHYNSCTMAYMKTCMRFTEWNRLLKKPLPNTMSHVATEASSESMMAPPDPKRVKTEVIIID